MPVTNRIGPGPARPIGQRCPGQQIDRRRGRGSGKPGLEHVAARPPQSDDLRGRSTSAVAEPIAGRPPTTRPVATLPRSRLANDATVLAALAGRPPAKAAPAIASSENVAPARRRAAQSSVHVSGCLGQRPRKTRTPDSTRRRPNRRTDWAPHPLTHGPRPHRHRDPDACVERLDARQAVAGWLWRGCHTRMPPKPDHRRAAAANGHRLGTWRFMRIYLMSLIADEPAPPMPSPEADADDPLSIDRAHGRHSLSMQPDVSPTWCHDRAQNDAADAGRVGLEPVDIRR